MLEGGLRTSAVLSPQGGNKVKPTKNRRDVCRLSLLLLATSHCCFKITCQVLISLMRKNWFKLRPFDNNQHVITQMLFANLTCVNDKLDKCYLVGSYSSLQLRYAEG